MQRSRAALSTTATSTSNYICTELRVSEDTTGIWISSAVSAVGRACRNCKTDTGGNGILETAGAVALCYLRYARSMQCVCNDFEWLMVKI